MPTERGLSVLVVEDDPNSARSFAALLQVSGYNVMTAPDGPTALRLAEREPPDVALIDVCLPNMDGITVAERLRSLARPRRPLLVAVTGYALDEVVPPGAAVDLCLPKPVDPDAVLGLLHRFERVIAPGEPATVVE